MVGQVLVIDPGAENVVVKELFFQLRAPGEARPDHTRVPGTGEKVGERVGVQIAQGQMVP